MFKGHLILEVGNPGSRGAEANMYIMSHYNPHEPSEAPSNRSSMRSSVDEMPPIPLPFADMNIPGRTSLVRALTAQALVS